MAKTWVYSDPHFYHKNIVTFTNYDGSKLRPWDDAYKMTEDLIEWYNEVVNDEDRVYILGDVAFTKTHFRNAVSRLKGRKVLIQGNHEPTKAKAMFAELFDDIRGYVVKKGFIMSHIPLHPQSMGRWKLNIHGHLHNNLVYQEPRKLSHEIVDDRYYNACVERNNFRPVLLDDILKERKIV